jgi:hypothetical protein
MPIRNLATWNQQKTLERFWDGRAIIERLAMMPNDALIYGFNHDLFFHIIRSLVDSSLTKHRKDKF